jgi:serine phosphatase RsbU (regulator of sigma subunit)
MLTRLFHPRSAAYAGSRALRDASLKSESRRAYVLILVIVLIAGMLWLRGVSGGRPAELTAYSGMAFLVTLQLCVLKFIHWARARDRGLPTWFMAITVVMENLPVAGAMMANITQGALPPYAALTGGPLLFLGILMALTTLRLRPWLCILQGILASGSYAAALAYVTYGLGITTPTTGLPWIFYANTVGLLFIASLACAFVAHEIRGHVEAALAEAETRRQKDRMERDLVVASSIQRALLPRSVPNIPGFDIAGWNRPAEQTGGDYYDWQRLPDGKWIVTVADVSGHGVGPALVTAACRAYVRSSSDHDGDLALLSSRVNRLLAQDLPDGRFVTMASAMINSTDTPVALLSAGHGPIVHYVRSTGTAREIMPQGMPLAVEPDGDFGPVMSIPMAAGDVLALVTDGFVEWARSDENGHHEQFGTSRLRAAVARHAHLPAAQIIEAITRDVTAFTHPTPQQDDLTMVIIRRVE